MVGDEAARSGGLRPTPGHLTPADREKGYVMSSNKLILTRDEVDQALAGLPQWRYRLGALVSAYVFDSAAAAIGFLGTVGALAEASRHHPDVDWRYDTVFITISSHDVGMEVTARDVDLAQAVSRAADEAAATSAPERHQTIELAIDTADGPQIAGFWKAVLGYEESRFGDLADPWRRNPAVWFQETATPNANRIHLDRHVPLSALRAERSRLLEVAGEGDGEADPNFRIYTDAQGNRICLCTEAGHGPDPGN